MTASAPSGSCRIAILGTGRMSRAVFEAAADQPGAEIVALVGPNAPEWPTDCSWHANLEDLSPLPDLLIDFSLPAGTAAAVEWCRDGRVPLLSGVTALPGEVQSGLRRAAEEAPVLWSPNLSVGVNLLAELAGRAAAVVGASAPVLIEDIHHQWKKDAPSGTALMLGEVVASQRGGDDGIDYHSVREGEVIGEHAVTFRMAGEEISLVHRAQNRSIYALGALKAGMWLLSQGPGLYTAADWLAGH